MGLPLFLELKPTTNNTKVSLNIDPSEPNLSVNSKSTNQSTYFRYYRTSVLEENIIDKSGSGDFEPLISANLPLLQQSDNVIKIPNKVERVVRRYIPIKLLKEIYPEKETAVELCLMFLSKLSATHFTIQDNDGDPMRADGWRAFHSSILMNEFDIEKNTYRKIVEALMYSTNTGPVIECDHIKIIGSKCYHYRLGEAYREKGVTKYELKTEVAKDLLQNNWRCTVDDLSNNVITKNLLFLYPHIQLPTKEDIINEAKRLIKGGFKNKKGKVLTFLNKHSRDYYSDATERSFVEDSLNIYEYLTDGGFIIPKIGSDWSGGRIVDSFTLMPSWIRNLCRIDGQRIVEVDYSALHPNICCTIYRGKKRNITHKQVAEEADIDLKIIKKEHLSFFNKEWEDMLHSPLYNYYFQVEPTMMTNIYYDKTDEKHNYGHKVTARKLFKVEVEIMTEVIAKLNGRGVYVGYVYDALFCKPEDRDLVKAVMDEVTILHGVYTTAKYDEFKKPTQGNLKPLETLQSSQENKLQLLAEAILNEAQLANNERVIATTLPPISVSTVDLKQPIISNYEKENAMLEDLYERCMDEGDQVNANAIHQKLSNRRYADKKYKISQRQRKKIESQNKPDLCPF
jgi:hypothetical protein